jgi:hypothetical protein
MARLCQLKGIVMKKFALLAATVCGLMASAAPAQVTLMDQIGPTPFTNASVRASQRFETANVNFDAGVGDDFIVPAGPAQHLTLVEAVISGFNGFTVANYANVQNYSVEIYSSQAAAVANLNGNVAHVVIPAASAVLTPFGNDPQRLVSLNLAGSGVDLVPGTYFISVIPRIDFTGNGHAVLGDRGGAEALLQNDVSAAGAESHTHGFRQLADSRTNLVLRFLIESNHFGHGHNAPESDEK